jgi:hypothetical protein
MPITIALLGAMLLAAPTPTGTPAAPKPGEAAKPAQVPATMVETLMKRIYSDRERSENWLRMDTESFLAAVKRVDFNGRTSLVIGSDPKSDLFIDDPLIRPQHVRVTVAGDSFHVQAIDDSAVFQLAHDESTPRDTTVGPSTIAITKLGGLWGRYNVRISHQQYPALILLDGYSPRFKEYRGRKSYTVDLNYRFVLPLTPNPAPDTIQLASTRGPGRPAVRAGWFDFMIGEKRCRLTALSTIEPGVAPGAIAVFFRDATSGKETSALGRYLEVRRAGANSYLLDFNMAVNPACAFSELYNCPVPPAENVLKVPILAGEKDLGYVPAQAQLKPH